jgi:hypothetical protein
MRPESEYSRADQFRKEALSDQITRLCCINLLSWQPSPDKFPQGSPEVLVLYRKRASTEE